MSRYAAKLKHLLWNYYVYLTLLGIDPLKAIATLRGLPFYLRDLKAIKKQLRESKSPFSLASPTPILYDRFAQSGTARGHYFHQDLLVAQRIFVQNPEIHVDVGSRVDGFVAHVASFRQIEVFDIRPMHANVPNVKFIQFDLMGEISNAWVDYCDSLSCLHALEHFGLGRYGDAINVNGHVVGLNNLAKLLKPGGKLYISVPIGPQRIEFNAHRVFSLVYLSGLFGDRFCVDRFSYVDDAGQLVRDVVLNTAGVEHNFGCHYGCGIFEMSKIR
jgi:SAM-dependent methyltransferase